MSCKGRREGVAKPGSPVLNASKKGSSNSQPKRRKAENVAKKAVVVAVRASREIPRTALVWALTHVVQPGDCLTLLVVVPTQSSGKKLWGFPRFAGDCASGQRRSLEMNSDITDTCSLMMLQLHDVYDPNNINLKMKIVSGTPAGAVAAESKRARAGWVILDKQLKHEQKRCMEDLQCNIVMMKRSQPKVLRLNLVKSPEAELSNNISSTSPDFGTPFTHTEAAASSISSSDPRTSPFLISDNKEPKRGEISETKEAVSSDQSSSGSSPSRNLASQPWVLEILDRSSKSIPVRSNVDLRNPLPGPPPICSICQHKTPLLGKPPRWFTYAELALATGGFSESNFLAEGGFGSVHRGILPDGQTVAVKQHKLASSQGDLEFCAEVEVLSCAQHRNVVMLLGFCVEDRRRLLVYEYVCNGSLDSHLFGCKKEQLEWAARRKIAVGAARGLRYLHEECRVGCIVHRDVRPNNILLTHDFEPLVGDFGLARWQPDGETGVETRVVGTFGYLAPEYTQSGQITDKADVFSFGVVLLELLSGRKAVDINRPKGQQCLAEWARPLLEEKAVQELLDPRLGNRYPEQEATSMLAAASLCLRRDPHSRPRMSQVLRILEGGDPVAEPSFYASTPWYDRGCCSARLSTDPPCGSQLSKVNHRRLASCDGLL